MKLLQQDTISYNDLFVKNRAVIEEGASPVVNAARVKAQKIFEKTGIPSSKVEAYKYTNLQPYFNRKYTMSFQGSGFTGNIEDIFTCNLDTLTAHTISLVNGKYVSFKASNDLPEGVVVGSFSQLSLKYPELMKKYYANIAPVENDALVALNTMLAQDGVFVYVPKNVIVEKPFQVVNILMGDEDRMVNQRNFIMVEENAQARVLICDHALTPKRFLVNTVTEAQVDAAGHLIVTNLENHHNGVVQVGSYFFNQEEKSRVCTNYFTLNAGVARNNINVRMSGEGAECHVSGLYLLDKNQHVDNFTFIDHAVPNCQSNELFKGVMDDMSTGSFTGRIMVRPDAQKTNAYQSNNNLLLTEDAKINTRPQLEIYADDVKCSHGATVGQLDEEALFYLRARGIGKEEASILLRYAFAYEVIKKISIPELKKRITNLVEKRFRHDLDKCDSCIICENKGSKSFLLAD
jgi:Fe-S cluster assembly protein SufD